MMISSQASIYSILGRTCATHLADDVAWKHIYVPLCKWHAYVPYKYIKNK